MFKMKRLLSTVLVLSMTLAMGTTSFASNDVNIPNLDSQTVLRHFNVDSQEESFIDISSYTTRDISERYSYASNSVDTKTIIGEDNRVRIHNTTSSPYYGIVYIRTEFNNGTWKPGTGFMISEDVLLTAGHCVYTAGTTVSSVEVYPGRNGNSYTISSTGADIYTDTKYTGSEAIWDYAIVTLNDNLGDTSGWFGLHATSSSSSLDGLSIKTAGYPSDKATGDNRTMWYSTGNISDVSTYRFDHNADTISGQSGSPMYRYSSTYGNQALGIHTHGGNSARRITNSLFDWLADNGFIHTN